MNTLEAVSWIVIGGLLVWSWLALVDIVGWALRLLGWRP